MVSSRGYRTAGRVMRVVAGVALAATTFAAGGVQPGLAARLASPPVVYAYVANTGDGTVSVINTQADAVTTTISLGPAQIPSSSRSPLMAATST